MKKLLLTGILLFVASCLLWAQTITTSAPSTTYVPQGNRAAILYEQLPAAGSGAYTSQEFPDYPTFSSEGADDFIVPAGETWNIETVTAFGGGFNGFIPSNVVNIIFYQDAGGIPGAVVQAYMGIDCTTQGVDPAANLVAMMPVPLPLPAGHYWLGVAEVAPFTTYGQWGRHVVYSVTNIQGMWINPGGGFGYGTAWQPGAVLGGAGPVDWAFRLEGTIGAPVVPLSTWALVLGGLLIAGFVVARTVFFRRA
jgi:hypothetical protein